MTPDEIVKLAMFEQMPTEPMNMPDALLWYKVAYIAVKLKTGEIIKAYATKLKQDALLAHKSDCVDYANFLDGMARSAEMYKRTELAVSAFRLEPSVENGWRIVEAIHER